MQKIDDCKEICLALALLETTCVLKMPTVQTAYNAYKLVAIIYVTADGRERQPLPKLTRSGHSWDWQIESSLLILWLVVFRIYFSGDLGLWEALLCTGGQEYSHFKPCRINEEYSH
jgi:hypothetical protein